MSTKRLSEKLLRFKAVCILVVSILFSIGLFGDDATISMVDQGEKFYKFGCMVAREVLKTNTGAEFDRLGNLKPECDPKKVIPRDIAKASKWVYNKVKKAVTKYGKSEMKKDKENPYRKKFY